MYGDRANYIVCKWIFREMVRNNQKMLRNQVGWWSMSMETTNEDIEYPEPAVPGGRFPRQ